MQVKCPKCRLRYDTSVPAGVQEVSCVCPRCGTPFTFLTNEDASDELDSSINSQSDGELQSSRSLDIEDINSVTDNVQINDENDHLSNPSPIVKTGMESESGKVKWENSPLQQRQFNHQDHSKSLPSRSIGCFGSCFISFLIILLIVVLGLRGCLQSNHTKKINGASLSQTLIDIPESNKNTYGQQVSASKTDLFEEIHPGKVPSWIQGDWKFHTSYGDILLHITGNKITEAIDDKVANGNFYYKNKSLVCDFGDPKNIATYRLDVNRQLIDAGNGMLMAKVSEK